jgi:hypothetical protein
MAPRIAHDGILTRVGMPQVTEHKTTVEHTFNKSRTTGVHQGIIETLGYSVVSKILPPRGLDDTAATVGIRSQH